MHGKIHTHQYIPVLEIPKIINVLVYIKTIDVCKTLLSIYELNWIFDTFVDLQENKQQTIRHGIIHRPKNSPLIIIFLKNIEKKF